MMPKLLAALALLSCLISLSPTAHVSAPDSRSAYRHYYLGSLAYSEGLHSRAVRHFQQAHRLMPDNFSFALSLGLGLCHTGQWQTGLSILNKSAASLLPSDPDYQRKVATKTFVEGLIYCEGGQHGRGLPMLRAGIQLQEAIGNAGLLSVYYNILGHAILKNKGSNQHKKGDIRAHSHLLTRDLARARDAFGQATAYDPTNTFARYNFQTLSDTLQMQGLPPLDSLQEAMIAAERPSFDLSSDIFQLLDLDAFDEVLFLLDISGSMVMDSVLCMRTTRFEVMRATSIAMLDQLSTPALPGIGTIGGDCGTKPRLWHPVNSLSRADLREQLEFLVPDGTTPMLEILPRSAELFSDSLKTRKCIFFVSDGANVCRLRGADICSWAAQLHNTTIHILSFLDTNRNNADAFTEYTCLADQTGGKILYIDNLRCRLEPFAFDMVKSYQQQIPPLHRLQCFGSAVEHLWGIYD